MWVRVRTGPRAGQVVRVRGRRFVVGSNEGCDLVLPGDGVAPAHAVFERGPAGELTLTDLGSRHGTFVATRRIRGTVVLRGGEELCFGETFAELARVPPARRGRTVAAAAAVLAVAAAAGAVSAVLLRDGGPQAAPPPSPVLEVTSTQAAAQPAPAQSAPSTQGQPQGGREPFAGGALEPPAFRDDFSDARSGWEVFRSETGASVEYEGGTLLLRIPSPELLVTSDSGRSFTRPVVSVEVLNPSRSASTGFGIVCRYRDFRNFTVAAVTSDGRYAVLERRRGVVSTLAGWTASPLIPIAAARYRLRASCSSANVRLAVNGQSVARVAAPGAPGTVGVFGTGVGEIRFDDFVAREGAGRG
jgi:hypothetical protein